MPALGPRQAKGLPRPQKVRAKAPHPFHQALTHVFDSQPPDVQRKIVQQAAKRPHVAESRVILRHAAKSPAFGPVGQQFAGGALHAQQRQQHERVRQAQQKLPGQAVSVGRIPHGQLTPQTRRALIAHQETRIKQDIAHAGGAHSYGDLLAGHGDIAAGAQRANDITASENLGDKQTRQALHELHAARNEQQRLEDVQTGTLLARQIHKTLNQGGIEALGRQARQPSPGLNAGAYRGTDYRAQHGGNLAKTLGVSHIPLLGGTAKTTGDVLNFLGRPLHASAGAVQAVETGGSVGEAIKRGLSGKSDTTFSDVLGAKGVTGPTKYIAGLGGDIVGDPLNWATFGAETPARVLMDSAQAARRAAETAGTASKARQLIQRAEELERQAQTAATNKGLRVGLHSPIGAHGRSVDLPLLTRATAALSRHSGLSGAAHALREGESLPAKTVQALGESFVPGFRPAGVDPAEWEAARNLERQSRAQARIGVRTAERRGHAYAHALSDAEAEQIANAIERAPHDPETAAAIREQLTSKRAIRQTPEFLRRRDEIVAPVEQAREAVRQATQERARQERMLSDSLSGFGVARGRAQILSRNVGGTAAERRAEALTVSEGVRQFAAGGHGVQNAAEGLRRATANVQRARVAQREAQSALEVTQANARAQLRQLTRESPEIAARYAEHSVSALPSHSIHALPEHLKPIALEGRRELADVGRREQAAGVLGALRQGYVPHQWAEKLAGGVRAGSRMGSARNVYAAHRDLAGSIAEINARAMRDGLPPIFSTDLPALIATRLGKSAQSLATHGFQRGLLDEGVAREIAPGTVRDYLANPAHERDSLYRVTKSGLQPVETRAGTPDLRAAEEALKSGDVVVGMNRMIGARYAAGHGFGRIVTTEGGGALGRGFDRFVSGMKTLFTVFNIPAYDLRNLTGDLWNSYLAHSSMKDIADGFAAMRVQARRHGAEARLGFNPDAPVSAATVRIGKQRIPTEQLLHEAEQDGAIQTGYVGGQLFEVTRAHRRFTPEGVRLPSGPASRVGQALRHPVESLRSVSQVREDGVRLGTYIGARRRGMSRDAAARWANTHHFDYQDLTNDERAAFRRIFPFWTFMARNTPLQAKRLLTDPGKFANYEALREESAKHAGLPPGWEQQLAPYQRRGGGIPFRLPGDKQARMAYPALPLVDLARTAAVGSGDWRGAFDLTLQNVNPLIKTPVEYGLNYSSFFRQPIYRTSDQPDARHWVPAPAFVSSSPLLRSAFGVKQMPDPANGGKKTWMWTAKADYLARQAPQTNFATQALTPARGSRGQTSAEAIASQLSGVKLGAYDRPTVELHTAQQHLLELHARQRDMQDSGADRKPHDRRAYTAGYRSLLDEIDATTKRIGKLKRGLGYAKPKPRARRPSGHSGTYGSGGNTPIYGGASGAPIYGSGGSSQSVYGG